jgi:hypothetical protein
MKEHYMHVYMYISQWDTFVQLIYANRKIAMKVIWPKSNLKHEIINT